MSEARIMVLGKVVSGHGVKGLARIKPFNPGSPAIRGSSEVWLRHGDERRKVRVRECRPHRGLFLVALEGIESLDDLQPWIGSVLEIDAAELPAPGEGELYHYEALGLEVVTTSGEHVGSVAEVMALPANDLWVVRREGTGGEVLIPVVGAIVTRIDLAARRATVNPIAGLLDLP